MKRHARIRVPHEANGLELLELLTRRFTYHDHEAWSAQLAAGRLLVNGVTATAAAPPLKAGDHIEYLVPELPEPPVDRNIRTLLEDPDLLAVNKPANLPCHPAGRFFAHTLWHILKEEHQRPVVGLINRLDRETSGVVLLALSPGAERHLRAQFTRHQVQKRYLVIVEGLFPDQLETCGWLEPDTACEVRKKRRFAPAPPGYPATEPPESSPQHEWAETSFRRLHAASGMSLLEATPCTGRQHQIRATLCSLGYPVVGDKLYGVDPTLFLRFATGTLTAGDRRRLRLNRQALHAWSLTFRHPANGTTLTVTAPPPPDLLGLLPGSSVALTSP